MLAGHTGPVWSVAVSPDGALVVSGSDDRTVRVWEVASGRELRVLSGHTGPVRSVAVSPDGALVVSGSYDGSVRVWEVASGRHVATMIGTREGWATLYPDNSYKIASEPDGSFWWVVKAVRFEPGELDRYDPSVRRLPDDAPLPLPADWHLVTPRVAPPGPRPARKGGLFRRR